MWNWLIRAAAESPPRERPVRRAHRWRIDVDEFGVAILEVVAADLNGSGEAPGVQLEFEHQGSGGRQAVALSAREAELTSKALAQAAGTIRPHERLRQKHQKWARTVDPVEAPTQVNLQPAAHLIDLTPEEATILAKRVIGVPGLERIEEMLEIPF